MISGGISSDKTVVSPVPLDVTWPRDCLYMDYDFDTGEILGNAEIPALRDTGTVCSLVASNNSGASSYISDPTEKFQYLLDYRPTITCETCCPEGFYCPQTWMNVEPGVSQVTCPVGHFCPDGFVNPIPCAFLQICPNEGLSAPDPVLSSVVVMTFLVVIFGLLPLIGEYIRLKVREEYRNKNTASEIESQFRHEQRLSRQETKMKQEDVLNTWLAAVKDKKHRPYGISVSIYLKMKQWASRAKNNVKIRGLNTRIFTQSLQEDRVPTVLTFRNVCVFKATKTLAAGKNSANTGIELKLDETKKYYLNHASGVIRPGRLTAIMGPSGCGKSTLITAITNRVPGNMYSGEIYLNSDPIEPFQLNKCCGYVPQEDIMNIDLTVKENLYYMCQLRYNPKSALKSPALRKKLVNEIIRNMGLHNVRHSPIGGGGKRGLSGGQRKRVNIAMELMHGPQVLFLDEPTSGLDASMSLKFLHFMQQYALTTRTAVAMVIHQPNKKCFDLIDDVVLLQPSEEGGRVAYSGSVYEGIKYFNTICDRTILPHENPADSFIDILSEGFPCKHYATAEPINDAGLYSYADIYDEELVLTGKVWKSAGAGFHVPTEMFSVPIDRETAIASNKRYRRGKPSWMSVASTSGAMFLNTQLNNIWAIIVADFSVTFIVLILCTMGIHDIQLMFVINMLIGLVAGLYGVSIFKDIDLLNRYRNSGISNSATFCGTIIASIPRLLFQNSVFSIPYKNIKTPLIDGEYLLAITLIGQGTAFMFGIILCVVCDGKSADVYSVILTLLFWTFSGLAPPARELDASLFGKLGMWGSYTSWMLKSEVVLNTLSRAPCGQAQHGVYLLSLGLLPSKYIENTNTSQPVCIANTTTDPVTGSLLYVYSNSTASFEHPRLLNAWFDYQDKAEQALLLFALFGLLAMMSLSQRQFLRLTIARFESNMQSFVEDLQDAFHSLVGLRVDNPKGDTHFDHMSGIRDILDDDEHKDGVGLYMEEESEEKVQENQRISQAARQRRVLTRSLLKRESGIKPESVEALGLCDEIGPHGDTSTTVNSLMKAPNGTDDVISTLHDKV